MPTAKTFAVPEMRTCQPGDILSRSASIPLASVGCDIAGLRDGCGGLRSGRWPRGRTGRSCCVCGLAADRAIGPARPRGSRVSMEPNFFERAYLLVRQIPRGRVASYGQIAALLGHPQAARTVGWALNGCAGRMLATCRGSVSSTTGAHQHLARPGRRPATCAAGGGRHRVRRAASVDLQPLWLGGDEPAGHRGALAASAVNFTYPNT